MADMILRWVIIVLLVVGLGRVAAHETDQFTVPPDRQFADLGDYFNRWAFQAIEQGVNLTNTQIHRAIAEHRGPAVLAELQSPPHVTMAVRTQWPWSVTQIEKFESILASPEMRDRYPGRVVAWGDRFDGMYQNAFFPLDIRGLAHILFFSSTIKIYGTYLGTDKLGHFTDEGIEYYFAYRSARDAGAGEREAIARAVRIGTDGTWSEWGMLGMAANADYSNGDLSANFAGFLFYRNLTEPVMLKGVLRPPLLVRDGPYWKLTDDVRPDSGFFARFISDHLDEALNPGYFDAYLRPGLRRAIRAHTAALLRHYCDEHGQPRAREWFDQKLRDLSTYWGIDYGHLGEYDELVSIGRSCFDPATDAPPSVDPSALLASADFGKLSRAVVRRPPLWEPAVRAVSETRRLTDGVELASAVRDGRPELVRTLLDQGADPNHCDATGITSLHRACRMPDVTAMLIHGGAKVNATDVRGRTPLHWAADEPGSDSVKVLLQLGARVNVRDHDGRTALYHAAASGNAAAVDALLRHGASPTAADDFGQTPLHAAARRHGSAAAELLSAGAAPGVRDDFGRTPLHEAARAGSAEAARRLLERGADQNARDDYGTTPLHLACRGGRLAVVRLLLEHGADVNARSAAGTTPLHEAALAGDATLVRILLEHGARTDLRDRRGRTPAQVAVEHGSTQLATLLRAAALRNGGGR